MSAGRNENAETISFEHGKDNLKNKVSWSGPGGIIDNQENMPAVPDKVPEFRTVYRVANRLRKDILFISGFDRIRLDYLLDFRVIQVNRLNPVQIRYFNVQERSFRFNGSR
jgi:hypothetical protein